MTWRKFGKLSWILVALVMIAIPRQAAAVPVITGGPLNAASYALNGLPSQGIAQGSIFVLFGTGLGPAQFTQINNFPVPTQLAGTSISVTVAGTTVNCLMIYTLANQVAAILPSSTPTGIGIIRVNYNGEASSTFPITVVTRRVGLFARNQAGSGPGIIQNYISDSNQPLNSVLAAATPGQPETIWATGIGAVTGNEAGGPLPADMSTVPVEVFVGDQPATVIYRGRSGCCAGIDQIVFLVPPGVQGCYVPVQVRVGGAAFPSNFTTMAIAPQSGPCSDPIFFTSADLTRLQAGGIVRLGEVDLTRFVAKIAVVGEGTLEGTVDLGEAHFNRYAGADLLSAMGMGQFVRGIPSSGSCYVAQFRYKEFFESILPGIENPLPHLSIDAGASINVIGTLGTKQILRESFDSPGDYFAELGGSLIGNPAPDFLNPGTFAINNGSGGTVVGAFNTSITMPSNITWINRDALQNSVIPRTQPLTVAWSGANSSQEYVFIGGSAANPATGSGAGFICSAPANAGSFTVPTRVLSAIPASGPADEGPVGFLVVGKAPLRQFTEGTLPSVGIAALTYNLLQLANVNFQ